MIPDATLHQIQDRIDIVELIAGYMPLKRAGRSFKACCPFHQEKTPSFIVSPDKQIFHCFGCGAGGNAFSFVMKQEKLEFREAAEFLAERAGVEIPKDRVQSPQTQDRLALILKINGLAADFYHQYLLKEKDAEPARQYLKMREIGNQAIAEFKLGYAPAAWDALLKNLKASAPESALEKAGLVIAKQEGGYYDRFRERIIFPILDARGACLAFGGRVLGDSLPKYLNSPETEAYVKGRHLYGFFQARKAIHEEDSAIVVEGYMDLIRCHQAGVRNAVASLGTALTPEQVRLLKRHTKNVFIFYDADKAGEMATLRGLELFLEEGLEVRIVRPPKGHDPDTFVREFGLERFRQSLRDSQSLFDYRLALLKAKFETGTLEARVKIANVMVELLSKVPNEILRSAWLKELGRQLEFSEEALLAQMRKNEAAFKRPLAARSQAGAPAKPGARTAERLLIGLMLESPEALSKAREELRLEDFQDTAARKIVRRLWEQKQPETAGQMISALNQDPESALLVSMACAEVETLDDREKALADCLLWLKRQRIHQDREGLHSELVAAQKQGDRNRVSKLLYDFNELNRGMRRINEEKNEKK